MARSNDSKSRLPLVIAIGGIAAGALLPKLLSAGRAAARKAGGTAFTSGVREGTRPNADPASGRPT